MSYQEKIIIIFIGILRRHFFPNIGHHCLFRNDLSWASLAPGPWAVETVSLRRLSPCRTLSHWLYGFLFLSSFLPFILVDVALGTDPSMPPLSNWLPGSHHCHFLITHSLLWASLRAGAVRPPYIDAHTDTHRHLTLRGYTLVHTVPNMHTLNYARTKHLSHTHTFPTALVR